MRPLGVAAGVFLASVAMRVPFVTAHLYAWDSTLYARALEHGFHVTSDPATESPHPPGYIWYVATAAAARMVVRDSNAALVLVSVVAGSAAAAVLYLAARRLVRGRVALVAALAFSASPVTWMYSEVAYPYTVLALLSLVLGWWLVDGRRPVTLSLALGALAGFRQDLLLVLGPLWLWRLAPLGPRAIVPGLAALAAGSLTWAAPTVLLSGGPAGYLDALVVQSGRVGGGSPLAGIDHLGFNLALVGEGLLWGLLPMGLILVADAARAALRLARGEARLARPGPVATGLVLWTAPALLFYLLVHIGEWGYLLAVLPPLVLAAAVRADRAVARAPGRAWIALGALAVIVPALVFVLAPVRFSAERLRDRDHELSSAAPATAVRAVARERAAYDVTRGWVR